MDSYKFKKILLKETCNCKTRHILIKQLTFNFSTFLLNLLGLYWLIKSYRFQLYNFITHDLYLNFIWMLEVESLV